ncbi:MAG: hypothetical protein IT367_13100 [Candidatus Hydrogenedentes bacterium]|nr:hypothetical protein [Candidatus Hydrogenedentota bacterium]
MRLRNLGFVALLAIAVAVVSGCNPDKNKLLFKPQAGAKRLVDTEEAMNMSMSLMGMSMNFGTAKEYTFEFAPKETDAAGVTTFDTTIKSVKFEMTGLEGLMGGLGGPGGPQIPGMPGGDDPFGIKSLKAAVKSAEGQTFTVKVNKLGEVTEVSGADAIADKASALYKAPALGAQVPPKQVLKFHLGDNTMKYSMMGIFTARPDKKLNIGDTWQNKVNGGDNMAEVVGDATFTVKERANGTVTAESVSKVEIKPGQEMQQQMGKVPGFTMEMSGQGSGTAKFDEATGWLIDYVDIAKVPGKMSFPAGQMGNVSMNIEASYKVSYKSYPG